MRLWVREKDGSGFTLLEIMIALAIIGITLSVILHTVNYHADILYENTVTTQMYQLAKEKMYELEESPVDAKGDLNDIFSFQNTVSATEESNVIQLRTAVRGYDREVTLTELVVKAIE